MNYLRLADDLRDLSYVHPVALDDDCKTILVKDFNLPPGYNYDFVSILLKLPSDYPESPPGIGDADVYLPRGLLFRGRKPEDYHESIGPSRKWAWWCYESIDWNPCTDNFITFFELLRAHMSNPKTKGFSS